jgi:hypothetical protein
MLGGLWRQPFCIVAVALTIFFGPAHCGATQNILISSKRTTPQHIPAARAVRINQLLEANALSRSGHIRVAQRLKIPANLADPRKRQSTREAPPRLPS